MKNKVCFHLATNWNTHYILGEDDGSGNIPKKIKKKWGYYKVIFEHGKFDVNVNGVAYAKVGDYKKLKKDKLKVVKQG